MLLGKLLLNSKSQHMFLICSCWGSCRDGNWNDENIPTPTLCTDDDERRLLVNQRLDPKLVDLLLRFMYRPEHADSVPPSLRLAPSSGLYMKQEVSPPAVAKSIFVGHRKGEWPLWHSMTGWHMFAIKFKPAVTFFA